MFAIIKTGGKQYRVEEGSTLLVEKLEANQGDKITLDQVLLVGDATKATAGTPLVKGATVTVEVVEQTRDKKVIIFKKKRRQNYRRKNGHRQHLTAIKVTSIKA